MTPRIGSLFAGYGGLDSAVQSVFGGELAWYADCCKFDKDGSAGHYEPHRAPCSIMAHHHPAVDNIGDVSRVEWAAVEPVDIITGGSPCQDLSAAGKRRGMTEGTRSNLWVAMREAIAQLRPALVVWENVRGAGSAEATSDLELCSGCMGADRLDSGPVLRALGRVVGDLADLGYVGGVHGIRAADVGSCHGRFRYFLVAHPSGDSRWLQYGDDGTTGHTAQSARRGQEQQHLRASAGSTTEPGESVGEAALLPSPRTSDTNGAGQHGEGGLDLRTAISLLPSPSAADGNGGGRLNSPGHQRTLPGTAKLLPTPRAGDGTKGGPNQRGSSGDLMLPSAVNLLPTPTTRDHKDHTIRREPHRPDDIDTLSRALDGVPAALLPTPAVNDMGAAYTPETWDEWTAKMKEAHHNGNGHGASLNIEAQRLATEPDPNACCPAYGQSWITSEGVDYGPAVRRWHDLTRCTPPPTEVGGKGGRRLSPAFSEWMMGLPAGHVTDVPGITRNEALKALGNGVVPQQAEAAIRFLLERIEVAA